MHLEDLNAVQVLTEDVLNGTSLLFSAPRRIISCGADQAPIAAAFKALEQGLDQGFWAAGFLSYELGYAFEPRLDCRHALQSAVPLLWFGLFDEPRRLSGEQADEWLCATSGSYTVIMPPVPELSRANYHERFEVTKQMIGAGDIYQLNLTFKAGFQIDGDAGALYRTLRAAQPVSHGAFIRTPEFSILSLSPELFIKREGAIIESRPMKGTEPRGKTTDADQAAYNRLQLDEKQRAENLMIVDLMRNDISRIAKVGSVRVPALFSVESYPTLHQMTSKVVGELKDNTALYDIMAALFPAGSITGAPKIRAMELICELEQNPRGVYCGSIGHIAPNRDMHLNVAIRTATILADGHGEIGIGSGIVADSDVDREYDEALLKMRFLSTVMDDFQLFETMLFDGANGLWLLDEHMARMEKSAAHFAFPFVVDEARTLLKAQTRGHEGERLRVRLVLSSDGALSLTKTALPQPTSKIPEPVAFVLSPSRLQSRDIFLQHKTTRRALYDREFEFYQQTAGAGEVVYLNEHGDLAEGSRTNIFLKIDGTLFTPPLSSGLLPGTLREHLLASGQAKEARLPVSALEKAQAIYLGNSVRGLQPAHWIARKKP